MKRKFLEDLGLEKDVIDKIMDANGKDIEEAKSGLDELKTEVGGLKDQIKDRDKQLTKLKQDAGDNEELKNKISELEKANGDAKKAYEAEIHGVRVDAAVSKALTESHAKNLQAVKALLDLDDAKLAEDGTVIGLQDQIKKLTEADDSKFLFDDGKPSFKGAEPGQGADPGEDGSLDPFIAAAKSAAGIKEE